MANKLDLAVAQITGYKHGKWGYSAKQLVEAMGLTKAEWTKIQDTVSLDANDIDEINDYFKIIKQ